MGQLAGWVGDRWRAWCRRPASPELPPSREDLGAYRSAPPPESLAPLWAEPEELPPDLVPAWATVWVSPFDPRPILPPSVFGPLGEGAAVSELARRLDEAHRRHETLGAKLSRMHMEITAWAEDYAQDARAYQSGLLPDLAACARAWPRLPRSRMPRGYRCVPGRDELVRDDGLHPTLGFEEYARAYIRSALVEGRMRLAIHLAKERPPFSPPSSPSLTTQDVTRCVENQKKILA